MASRSLLDKIEFDDPQLHQKVRDYLNRGMFICYRMRSFGDGEKTHRAMRLVNNALLESKRMPAGYMFPSDRDFITVLQSWALLMKDDRRTARGRLRYYVRVEMAG